MKADKGVIKMNKKNTEVTYAKYGLKKTGYFTKDGHTMFNCDVLKDLERKSYLESRLSVEVAIEITKYVDKTCKNVPHDIGMKIRELILKGETK